MLVQAGFDRCSWRHLFPAVTPTAHAAGAWGRVWASGCVSIRDSHLWTEAAPCVPEQTRCGMHGNTYYNAEHAQSASMHISPRVAGLAGARRPSPRRSVAGCVRRHDWSYRGNQKWIRRSGRQAGRDRRGRQAGGDRRCRQPGRDRVGSCSRRAFWHRSAERGEHRGRLAERCERTHSVGRSRCSRHRGQRGADVWEQTPCRGAG